MSKIHLEISNQVPRGIANFKVKIGFDHPGDMILAIQYCMDLSPEFRAIIGVTWQSYEKTKVFRMLTPPVIVMDYNGNVQN